MKQALGFIGLGVMGFPMAGHLSNKGYKVSVFNRSIKNQLTGQINMLGMFVKHHQILLKNLKL